LPPGSATTAAPAPEASGAAIVRRFDRARALALAGFPDQARAELAEIERRASSVADRRALMVEYRDLGNWYRASMLGEIAFGPERLRGGPQKERDLWEFAYPRAFNEAVASAAKQSAVAGHLVWSIMRAESHYRQDAYSPVGALGLMQLMPFTGKKVADLLGTGAQFQPRSLLDPEVNIRLGARYLQRLSETFSGSIPLIAAGYNAGPHRVQAWLKSFGLLEMDEFIEHIPFMETRNYCKKVVRNYQVYSLLYDSSGRSLKWLTKPVGVTFDAAIPTREAW
jgi:soluble lytic murein transglycosylase